MPIALWVLKHLPNLKNYALIWHMQIKLEAPTHTLGSLMNVTLHLWIYLKTDSKKKYTGPKIQW